MQLRDQHSPPLSQEQLGDMVGASKSKISRIESGETELNVDMLFRIARALGVSILEVIDVGELGIRADVTAVDPDPPTTLSALAKRNNQTLYRVDTNALDELDIRAGEIVPVDTSAASIAALRPMMAVLVDLIDQNDSSRTLTLIRQYVPPNLLVTNSRSENFFPPINTALGEAVIRGVLFVPHNLKLLS